MKDFKIETESPLSIAEQIEVLELSNLDWLIERLKEKTLSERLPNK